MGIGMFGLFAAWSAKFQVVTLVVNMVDKNRSRFPIAVLLTTLVCSHIMIINIYVSFFHCKFKCLEACDTPL